MFNRNYLRILTLSLVFVCQYSSADKWNYFISTKCTPNPSLKIKNIPKDFYIANDLSKSADLTEDHEFFIITGKLLDHSCVPIAEAKVNAWQYIKERHGNKTVTKALSGTTHTNNLGIFNFVAAISRSDSDKVHNINLKVSLDDGLIENYNILNIERSRLESNNIFDMHSLYGDEKFDQMKQYRFDWTLDISNNFVSY